MPGLPRIQEMLRLRVIFDGSSVMRHRVATSPNITRPPWLPTVTLPVSVPRNTEEDGGGGKSLMLAFLVFQKSILHFSIEPHNLRMFPAYTRRHSIF